MLELIQLQVAVRKASAHYAYSVTYYDKDSAEYKDALKKVQEAEKLLHNYYSKNS